MGSPPRMRGTRCNVPISLFADRITPAHAGNTLREKISFDQEEDHPRACGEHRKTRCLFCSFAGSPPRMRGTPSTFGCEHLPDGITPAHAGNTYRLSHSPSGLQDHPRACGEHMMSLSASITRIGSPPRMRGTRCWN